ncbi:bifunctional 4-hydroxy-2-oxoglutarate aldolase/2-dehydro-3-deoxy-phosphogluconate aldolase [Aquimarina sp. RZ0]|uniref:bifunctional 4-hydroxy-2-oxoglutarate aldolase/2-dehydro-3-deoxy-phosphogluconate aldolase n=1 Tax=Aquimarina sp. RZ0 TaxID=2607730 RepID=UPI0011F18CDF|nr:bifunctional 4-hydroxy-2-oxoglutarate aldolase/2-dehydro-3-deoxy-phosphogluconate aldolase [Aquimarina sp. RZ0]KAA1247864.1 bifunctional 4-hydroxy-2-oxoglutarate aldolase/2-dehydro-3-deoxy-phosphogluconate aldolase [Aquimarina sp. RZ0]
MNRQEKLTLILEEKIVAIIRSKVQSDVNQIIEALASSGIKALEITSNTVGFMEEIKKARAKYPDILVGAGTITNTTLAKQAVDAGAQFIVTPNTNTEVIKYAHLHELPVLMGALTPSEICEAEAAGADVVKLFPSGTENIGIPYYKAVSAPLDNITLFAVGGIGLHNIKAWFEAGIQGVGVGGKLTTLNENNTLEDIRNTAKQMLDIIKNF